jgi:hypothetical protein
MLERKYEEVALYISKDVELEKSDYLVASFVFCPDVMAKEARIIQWSETRAQSILRTCCFFWLDLA